VLGRLMPPTVDIRGDAKVRASVQVIGYRKSWFLVDAGPHFDLGPLDADPDAIAHPPPGNPKSILRPALATRHHADGRAFAQHAETGTGREVDRRRRPVRRPAAACRILRK
jgi:hypothetical protein